MPITSNKMCFISDESAAINEHLNINNEFRFTFYLPAIKHLDTLHDSHLSLQLLGKLNGKTDK